MRLRLNLLRYQLRPVWWLNIVVALGIAIALLLLPDVLAAGEKPLIGMILCGHAIHVLLWTARFDKAKTVYLYSRGFSRNALWSYRLLATAVSILIVCIPAALIVWGGVRSWFQDSIMHSANFPVMAPDESALPLVLLGGEIVLLPACLYMIIRRQAPVRGLYNGSFILVGMMACIIALGFGELEYAATYLWGSIAWMLIISGGLVVVSHRLHRQMELGGRTVDCREGESRLLRLFEIAAAGILALILIVLADGFERVGLVGATPQRLLIPRWIVWGVVLPTMILAVWAAWRRRSLGWIVGATVLVLSLIFWANGRRFPTLESPTHLTISLNTPYKDAELYINGVSLGTSPVTLPRGQMREILPVWNSPPAGWTEDTKVLQERPNAISSYPRSQWDKMETNFGTFYLRTKLSDEWGVFSGGGGGGRIISDSAWKRLYTYDVVFPSQQQELRDIFAWAVIMDFQVGRSWGDALDKHGEEGVKLLAQIIDQDSRMSQAVDSWAKARYGIHPAMSPDQAWAVFELLLRETEDAGRYSSRSMLALAVERVVPHLPGDRLIAEASAFANRWFHADWGEPKRDHSDESYFAYDTKANSHRWPPNTESVPASGYVYGHAIWCWHDLQVAAGASTAALQTEIVPLLIRKSRNNSTWIDHACYLGGPTIATYVLRKASNIPRSEVHNPRLTKWLVRAADLKGPEGDRFRQEEQGKLFELANWLGQQSGWSSLRDFIFVGPDFAMAYWPEYAKQVRQKGDYRFLSLQFKYLNRMGEAAAPEMYIETWMAMDLRKEVLIEMALDELDTLSEAKREVILQALLKDTENRAAFWKRVPRGEELPQEIRRRMTLSPEQRHVEQLLANVRNEAKRHPDQAALWLRAYPWSPVVTALAVDEDAKLQALAAEPLAAWPTPEHVALLEALASDEDAAVREAADKAQKALTTFREEIMKQEADQ